MVPSAVALAATALVFFVARWLGPERVSLAVVALASSIGAAIVMVIVGKARRLMSGHIVFAAIMGAGLVPAGVVTTLVIAVAPEATGLMALGAAFLTAIAGGMVSLVADGDLKERLPDEWSFKAYGLHTIAAFVMFTVPAPASAVFVAAGILGILLLGKLAPPPKMHDYYS